MRNPWGTELYNGDWSDKSTKWTAALKKEVGLVNNMNDGFFYISLKDFKASFPEMLINLNPGDMFSSYFLRLDDDGTKASKCVENKTSTKCRRHTLTLKSDVAQTVYLTAHVWGDRYYPKKCRSKTLKNYIGFADEGGLG